MPNALQITDPNADNPLAQAPSWADAYGSVRGAVSSGVDALGQWLAAQRAKQQRPPMWSMSNPVGTETTRQPQQLTMPTPGVQDVAFWGGQPVSQQFKDTAQSAIGNALGWVGSAGPGGPIRAFHGSPYDFERFDTSKIGTGEGAQAYGHGLYFAEGEGTARSYRDALADQNLVWPNDEAQALHAQLPSHLRQQYRSDIESGKDPTDWLNRVADGAQRHAEYVQAGGQPSVNYGPDGGFALADAAKQLADQPLAKTQSSGKMYEVNIGADPEQFLHWDKPLSEQSPQVQDAWQNVVSADKADVIAKRQALHDQLGPNSPFGAGNPVDAYSGPRDLKQLINNDPVRATQLMQQAGIPGIRYLDQGSRGAGEGTHNYVVFDANTIDILRKYGLAGLGIGLSGAAAGTQGQPQQ